MPHRIRRRRRGGVHPAVAAAMTGLALIALTRVPAATGTGKSAAVSGPAATAIGYARGQLGKPYLWGGTGPDAYDCSGLVYEGYRGAGVRGIPRTSQEQWAWGPQVSTPEPGDLVFFAGGDGTPASPGHVGIVVDPARHLMIEAYAAGYPIRYSQFGTPGSAPGDQDPVGYTDPAAHGGS